MKYLASLLILFALAGTANAQTTNTQTSIDFPDFLFYLYHVPTLTTTFTAKDPSQLAAVLTAGDTNANWDFSKFEWVQNPLFMGADSFSALAGTPLASDPDFDSANEVVTTHGADGTLRYTYMKMAPGQALFLGCAEDKGNGARKVVGYNPPYLDAVYPMHYGTTWESSSVISGDTLPPGETVTISSHSVADGWGNFLFSMGSKNGDPATMGAVRVKKVTVRTWSFNGSEVRSDTVIEHNFFTRALFSGTITTNTRNEIQNATYTVNRFVVAGVDNPPLANGLNVSIVPNPSRGGDISVNYTLPNTGMVSLELMDALGRNVRMLERGNEIAGPHTVTVDTRGLARGEYFIQATCGGVSTMQKLAVTE